MAESVIKSLVRSPLTILVWLFILGLGVMSYLFTEHLIFEQKERVKIDTEVSAKGLVKVVNHYLSYHRLMLESLAEHHRDRLFTLASKGGYPFDLEAISSEIDQLFPDAVQFAIINHQGESVIGSSGLHIGKSCQLDIEHHVVKNNILPAQIKVHQQKDGKVHYDMVHVLHMGHDRAAIFISFSLTPFRHLMEGFSNSEIEFSLVNRDSVFHWLVPIKRDVKPLLQTEELVEGDLLLELDLLGSGLRVIGSVKPGVFADYALKVRLIVATIFIILVILLSLLLRYLNKAERARKMIEENSVQDALFNAGPTVLFKTSLYPVRRIQYVSPNISQLIGRSSQQVLALIDYDKIVFEGDLSLVEVSLETALEKRLAETTLEYRLNHVETGAYWVSDVTHILYDDSGEAVGLQSYVTSINAQKSVEQGALALIDDAPDAMAVTDKEGAIIRINNAFEALFEYRREELVGHSIEICIDESSRELFQTFNAVVMMENAHSKIVLGQDAPVLAITKSAKTLQVEVSLSGIHAVTGELSMVHTIRDVSMQLRIKEQMLIAQENAEKLAKARSRFVATMSHEIRTPLNGILGMSHLLAATSLTKTQQGYLDAIEYSGQALLTIINGILDFAKLDEGAVSLKLSPFDLAQTIQDSLKMLSTQADDRCVRLHYDGPETGCLVMGDAGKVQQILINLVGNAIKFSHGTRVEVILKALGQATDEAGRASYVIEVEDFGVGIDPKSIETLFDSFTQADESSTRSHGGTGLGLAITKQLVALMEGEVTVTSARGKGSVFRVELPFKRVNNLPEALPFPQSSQPQLMALEEVRPLKHQVVLLVEDNEINQKVIVAFLERLGAQVDVAVNGVEGLSFWHTNMSKYSLVLMDCEMPVMDGYEATVIIRREEQVIGLAQDKTPIIALTANAMHEDKQRCYDVGMSDFISKPIIVDEFNRVVLYWANQQKAPSSVD
ncbi:MAG: response regulator [Gammaproteobacteria bacterium]|nr:response regulator [Gammaproteobacteria bacterium]